MAAMKRRIAVSLFSAVFTAAVTIMFVGPERTGIAEAAAQCMEETHDLRDCSRPEDSVWPFVGLFAFVGSLVGAVGY